MFLCAGLDSAPVPKRSRSLSTSVKGQTLTARGQTSILAFFKASPGQRSSAGSASASPEPTSPADRLSRYSEGCGSTTSGAASPELKPDQHTSDKVVADVCDATHTAKTAESEAR